MATLINAIKTVSCILDPTCKLAPYRAVSIDGPTVRARTSSVDVQIRLDVQQGDAIVLEAKALAAILATAPKGARVRVERTDVVNTTVAGSATVTADGALIGTLPCTLSQSDLPRGLTIDGTPTTLEIDIQALRTAVNACEASISTDSVRATSALAGLALDTSVNCAPGTIAFVATDGHRLHAAILSGEVAGARDRSIRTLPMGAVKLLGKLIGKRDTGLVRLAWDAKVLTITPADGAWHIACAWIDARFPDYRQVIPDAATACNSVTLDGAALRAVCTRAKALPKIKGAPQAIALDVGDCEIGFSAGSVDNGATISGKQPCERTGEHVKLGLDPRYVLEALDAVYPDDGPVTIHYATCLDPIVLKTCDRLVVVMPVRL